MDISLSSSCTASKLSSAEELINVEAQSRMTHSKNWLGLSKLGPGQNYWQLWSSINSRIRGRQSAPPPIKRSIPEFHQGPAHERSWAKVEIECAPTKHKKDRSRNILRGKGNAEGHWISAARSTAVRKTAATARLPAPYSRRQRGLDPRRALLLLLQRPMRERLPVRVYTTIVVSLRRVGHMYFRICVRVNVIKKCIHITKVCNLKMNTSKFLHLIIPFSFKN